MEDSDDSSDKKKEKPKFKPQKPSQPGEIKSAKTDVSKEIKKANSSHSNIMDTNWGADVFGIVEHDSELDDDSADEDKKTEDSDGDRVRTFSWKESERIKKGNKILLFLYYYLSLFI